MIPREAEKQNMRGQKWANDTNRQSIQEKEIQSLLNL